MEVVWTEEMTVQTMKWRRNRREMAKNAQVEVGGLQRKIRMKNLKQHKIFTNICDAWDDVQWVHVGVTWHGRAMAGSSMVGQQIRVVRSWRRSTAEGASEGDGQWARGTAEKGYRT